MKRQLEKNNQNILVFSVDACSLTVQKACLMSMCCVISSSKGHQVAFSPACLQSFSRIRKINVNSTARGGFTIPQACQKYSFCFFCSCKIHSKFMLVWKKENRLCVITDSLLKNLFTVFQNPRSRSLIQKWSSYKKYFFYALGSSVHHISW